MEYIAMQDVAEHARDDDFTIAPQANFSRPRFKLSALADSEVTLYCHTGVHACLLDAQ
jgi:hypothetical protein